MNLFISALLGLLVAGCTTQQATLVSNNPNLLVIGTKPEGYPRLRIEPYPGFPGLCFEVKEDWRKDDYQGQTVWLKDSESRSVHCP